MTVIWKLSVLKAAKELSGVSIVWQSWHPLRSCLFWGLAAHKAWGRPRGHWCSTLDLSCLSKESIVLIYLACLLTFRAHAEKQEKRWVKGTIHLSEHRENCQHAVGSFHYWEHAASSLSTKPDWFSQLVHKRPQMMHTLKRTGVSIDKWHFIWYWRCKNISKVILTTNC